MPKLRIKRHANGTFYAHGTIERCRIRKSLGTGERRHAERRCAALEAEVWQRGSNAGSLATFATAALTYMEAGGERRFLAPLIRWFKDTRLDQITANDIRRAASSLYPDATAATRNRQAIVPARAVINHAAAEGWCNFIRVRRFPEPKPNRIAVDRAWIDAFMAAAPDRLAALLLFMFTTGARLGEAERLPWSDIDFEARTALLRHTKNGDDHIARLVPELVIAIANLPRINARVFGYEARSTLYKHWRASCTAAGIAYVPPHQAGRHSFATELIIRHRIDVATVARLGNWKSHRILTETYAHPENEGDIVDAVF